MALRKFALMKVTMTASLFSFTPYIGTYIYDLYPIAFNVIGNYDVVCNNINDSIRVNMINSPTVRVYTCSSII